MKIIIVGCGKVGYTIAEQLAQEKHSVTVIDNSLERLSSIRDAFDVMTICGNGSSVSVLKESGIKDTDMFISVTNSDELNLLCCLLAKNLHENIITVARVRNPIYNEETVLLQNSLGISMIINPEQKAAMEISRLLNFPSAITIDPFARERVRLVKFKVTESLNLDGLSVMELSRKIQLDILISGVQRQDQAFIPNGDFVLKNGDLVSVLGTSVNIAKFFHKIGLKNRRVRNCMIIGGGPTTVYLAKSLAEMKIKVTIIEQSKEKCDHLAEILPSCYIIHGDGTNRRLLEEEGINQAEAFVSLTNIDEENILISYYAARKGNCKVITKINRIDMKDFMDSFNIGSIVSPKYITSDSIIQYTRAASNSYGSNVETLYHILDGRAEALEFAVNEKSRVINTPLKDLKVRDNTLIGCIIRESDVIIPRGNDMICSGDGVVIITTHTGMNSLEDILR
ncbi:MAG: Trk system potassium transporter TrkA [Erysipelotrichaceae bacterium]|nr:Trk system potassium transporter TrkA [Erysipelotrichaceae bacterium]